MKECLHLLNASQASTIFTIVIILVLAVAGHAVMQFFYTKQSGTSVCHVTCQSKFIIISTTIH